MWKKGLGEHFNIYILSKLGFRVCASTGKVEKESLLRRIGAKEIIHCDEFKNQTDMPLLKMRFSAIVDNTGGNIISTGARQLIEGGKIASIGMTSDVNFKMNLMPFILRGIQIIGINAESTSTLLRKKIWKKITKVSKDGLLKLIYRECNIKNSIKVIREIKNNTNVGRVIVKIL